MSNSLRDSIAQLATNFVTEVLAAVRGASLEDLASETGRVGRPAARPVGRPPGRRPAAPAAAAAAPAAAKPGRKKGGKKGRIRRSASDIAGVIEKIVGLLRSSPGLRAEEIRSKLGLANNEIPRPIQLALAEGKLKKTGEKRATRYFVGGKGGASAAGKAGAKKGKPGRKKADATLAAAS